MPRQNRLGLGAKPLTHEEIKRLNKKEGTRIISTNNILVDENELKIGVLVIIIDGSHQDKEAKIIKISNTGKVNAVGLIDNDIDPN